MSNLLIGGSGFIGSALSQALAKANEPVISLSRSRANFSDDIEQVLLNLDVENIPESLLKNSPDVYILTGQVGLGFDAAREMANLKRIIVNINKYECQVFFFSTALVYGNCLKPASETTPPKPIGSYPIYKYAAEQLVQQTIRPEKLTIIRLGNVYGNLKNRGFIDLVLRSLLQNSPKPITLSNDGQTLRDYIFIDDVVNAMLTIKRSASHHGIINLVSGASYSLRDIVTSAEVLMGKILPIDHRSTPKIDELLAIRTTNILLRNNFGFKAFTPIKSGLKQTLRRYQKELL